MIEVKVDGLALDVMTNSAVVILTPKEGTKPLPIWIGDSEAWAIEMERKGLKPKRPMTHDLLTTVIGVLSATVEKVEITELIEQTFYARVWLKCDGEVHEIDARPSDSIALALKAKAPIYAEETLFNLGSPEQPSELKKDPESLADRLKKINPEDFGKYSL